MTLSIADPRHPTNRYGTLESRQQGCFSTSFNFTVRIYKFFNSLTIVEIKESGTPRPSYARSLWDYFRIFLVYPKSNHISAHLCVFTPFDNNSAPHNIPGKPELSSRIPFADLSNNPTLPSSGQLQGHRCLSARCFR